MHKATMSVWPLVVAFTHVLAHDYADGHAEHGRNATAAEIQVSRKRLKALHQDGLLSKTKTGNSDLFSYRGG